jgi:glycolate oxidase
LYDGRQAGALDRAEELAAEIISMCIRYGGSVTGEHGIGIEKRQYLPRQYSELDVDVMHTIRLAIDPQEISNRGKMFPGGDAPVMKLRGLHPLEKAGIISRE